MSLRGVRKSYGADEVICGFGRLGEMFGGLNDDAKSFICGFVDDLPRMIGEIDAGLAATDSGRPPPTNDPSRCSTRGTGRGAGVHRTSIPRESSGLVDPNR